MPPEESDSLSPNQQPPISELVDWSKFMKIVFSILDWGEVKTELSALSSTQNLELRRYVRRALNSARIPESIFWPWQKQLREIILGRFWEKMEEGFKATLGDNFHHPTVDQLDRGCSELEQKYSTSQIIGALSFGFLQGVPAKREIEEVLLGRYKIAVPKAKEKSAGYVPDIAKPKPKRDQAKGKKDVSRSKATSTRLPAKPKPPAMTPDREPQVKIPKAKAVSKLSPKELDKYLAHLAAQKEATPQVDRYLKLAEELNVPYEWISWVAQRMWMDFEHSTSRQVNSVRKRMEMVFIPLFFVRINRNDGASQSFSQTARKLSIAQVDIWAELASQQLIRPPSEWKIFLSTEQDVFTLSQARLTKEEVQRLVNARTTSNLRVINSTRGTSRSTAKQPKMRGPRGASSHFRFDENGGWDAKDGFASKGDAEKAMKQHRRDFPGCYLCKNSTLNSYECVDENVEQGDSWHGRTHWHWGHGWPES